MRHPTAQRTTRAPALRSRTVRTAVWPGNGGEQQEEEVVGDGGQLKYVSYMMANAASNAGIAEATVAHLKARGVEPGGDLDTVVLGGEQTPLVTFWGVPQELIEKTEDVMMIGSDPRDSLMFGFEVPMNIDLKMAMKAVRKINKKTWSVNPHAPELKMTLVTQPELFSELRGVSESQRVACRGLCGSR